jgi:hypothetical protein
MPPMPDIVFRLFSPFSLRFTPRHFRFRHFAIISPLLLFHFISLFQLSLSAFFAIYCHYFSPLLPFIFADFAIHFRCFIISHAAIAAAVFFITPFSAAIFMPLLLFSLLPLSLPLFSRFHFAIAAIAADTPCHYFSLSLSSITPFHYCRR